MNLICQSNLVLYRHYCAVLVQTGKQLCRKWLQKGPRKKCQQQIYNISNISHSGANRLFHKFCDGNAACFPSWSLVLKISAVYRKQLGREVKKAITKRRRRGYFASLLCRFSLASKAFLSRCKIPSRPKDWSAVHKQRLGSLNMLSSADRPARKGRVLSRVLTPLGAGSAASIAR